MGKLLGNDVFVKVAGVDLSNDAFNVDIHLEKERVEVSGFNATGTKEFLPGQATEEVTVSFRQDFASGKVDATLWPLYSGGSAFAMEFRPTSGTPTATNPVYSGSANLYEYHPIDVAFGDVMDTQVTFAFTGAVARGTA